MPNPRPRDEIRGYGVGVYVDESGLGAFVHAQRRSPVVEVRSPFDDGVLARVPRSNEADVASAFVTAARAQPGWAARTMGERAAVLRRFAALVQREHGALLDLIQTESGKARTDAFEEVADVALWAAYVARRGPGLLRPRRRAGALPVLTRTVEQRVPHGVVGVITPWNYPFTLPASDTVPALLAGNAVVLKPDSLTPLSSLRVAQLLQRAGLPDGVLQVVVGDGPTVGAAVVDLADHVVFTGSTETGRTIARRCGERLVSLSAELGGKNPLLVLADADVDRAAAGAVRACFANTGQLCVSIERVYVHSDLWDAFVPIFLERVGRLRLGPGRDWDVDVGSLAGPDQLCRVRGHVADAVAGGARVLAGGRARPDLGPYFFEPTVLTDVRPGMRVASEETFGPVVSLYQVASDAAAVEAANDSPYGLNASVWTRRRGPAVARRLMAGSVNVNEGYAASWGSHDAPMGGLRDSGLGRRHGREGILSYTQTRTVATQRGVPIAGPADVDRRRWAGLLAAGIRVLTIR